MSVRYLAAAGVLLAGVAVPASASASPAYATRNIELREGPGTQYSIITMIPPGHPVDVIHCTFGYGWCEVVFLDYEGWASGFYLRDDSYYVLYDYGPRLGIPIYRWTRRDLQRRRDFRKRYRRGDQLKKTRRDTTRTTVTPRKGQARPADRREEKNVFVERRREYDARRNENDKTRVNPRRIRRGDEREEWQGDDRLRESGRGGPVTRRRY